ncbi:MAG: ABC transporter permease [Planctomycetes bacterium]|nr:ABC transporter permease [Planctomycetota bacterium]
MSPLAVNAVDYGAAPASRSPSQMAFRRFLKNRKAVISMILLAVIGLATLLVPWLTPFDYRISDWDYTYGPPNARYWMGTDSNGRDLMSRVFIGGRVSFAVGFLATTVSVIIGVAYGATSGFLGGKVDLVLMRFVDILYGLPYMLIVIIVMALVRSKDLMIVFLVLGLFGWLTMSRIVRGQVLSLKEREFVEAARGLGTGTSSIISRHMIPNILGPVIVYTTLSVPSVMLQESFLSFLGLGVSEPETSWGVLISEGAGGISGGAGYWWLIVFPGAALAITLYCLNSIGDGLRDAFDVQQR